MIEQTYYPFGGDSFASPTHKVDENESTKEGMGWLGWVILIATLLGMAAFVYWWREKMFKPCLNQS